MRSVPEAKVRFFLDLFRCRSDVYALRWENRRDGRSGWMPAIRGYWRKGMNRADAPYLPLTPDVVDQHLRGEVHIGLYPLGDDDTCWWVAADFDKEAAMLDALAYMKAARAHNVPAALEVSQSGRGAHVWIFFAQATSAATARSIATSLVGEAFQLRGSMHLSSYDRLFPSQDIHTGRGMGNLIAAPLNGKRRQHGTTLFLRPRHAGTLRRPMGLPVQHRAPVAQRCCRAPADPARSTIRPSRAPAAATHLVQDRAEAGGDHSGNLRIPTHPDRQRSWSGHDRGRQARSLHSQSRV
jgi:hypothetical protein